MPLSKRERQLRKEAKQAISKSVKDVIKQIKSVAIIKYTLPTIRASLADEELAAEYSGGKQRAEWQSNVKVFVEANGVDMVCKVMKRHVLKKPRPGQEKTQETVMLLCMQILGQIPKHSEEAPYMSWKLVEAGAITSVLKAVEKHPNATKALAGAMNIVRRCADQNPEKVGNKEIMEAIMKTAASNPTNEVVAVSTAQTYGSLCKNRKAAAVFVEQGGLETVLANLSTKPQVSEAADAEITLANLNCINSLASFEMTNIERIKKARGLKTVVEAIARFSGESEQDQEIQRIGKKIIMKVAGALIDQIIKETLSPDTSPADREYNAQLLSQLSAKTKYAKKILNVNGIAKMLELIKDPSATPTMQAAVCLILKNIALNEQVKKEEIKLGAFQEVVNLINNNKSNSLVLGPAMSLLQTLVINQDAEKKAEEAGAIGACMAVLQEHPEFKDSSIQAMKFIGKMVTNGYPVSKLIELKGVEGCLGAINAQPGVVPVAANGLLALNLMAEADEKCAIQVAQMGGITIATKNLHDFPNSTPIVLNGLKLLRALAGVEQNIQPIIQANGVISCVEAIYAQPDNREIKKVGIQVLKAIVSDQAVLDALESLRKNVGPMCEKGDKDAAGKVQMALMALSIYADVAAPLIQKHGGVKAAIDALKLIVKSKKAPKSKACINGCFRMLNELVQNKKGIEDELNEDLLAPGNLDVVVDYLKKNPKSRSTVRYAIKLLGTVVNPTSVNVLIDMRAIEAIGAAMPLNLNSDLSSKKLSSTVANAAAEAFAQFGATKEGGVALAEHNATRELLKALRYLSVKDTLGPVCMKICRALEGAARTDVGVKTLNKQDAVTTLVDAMTKRKAGGKRGKDDDEFNTACNRIIARLLSPLKVRQLTLELVKATPPESKEKALRTHMNKLLVVSLISQVGNNADIVAKAGGPQAFQDSIVALDGFADSEAQRDCMNAAIDGLGLLAKKVEPSLYKEAVPIVFKNFELFKTPEALMCLSRLATHTENMELFLESGGGKNGTKVNVLELMGEMLKGDDLDDTMAATVMKVFGSFALLDPKAREKLGSIGLVEEVLDWLKKNAEEAPADAIGRCLQCLCNLALDPTNAKKIAASPVFETIVETMTERPLNSDCMAAGMNLLANICIADPSMTKALNDQGTAGHVMNMFFMEEDDDDAVRSANVHGDESSTAACNFMLQMTKNSELKDSLKMQKVDKILLSLMKENPSNNAVQQLATQALGMILSPADLLLQTTDKIDKLMKKVDAGDKYAVKLLTEELGNLSNAVKMPGAVNELNAMNIVNMTLNIRKKLQLLETNGGLADGHTSLLRCEGIFSQIALLKLKGVDLSDVAAESAAKAIESSKDGNMTPKQRIGVLQTMGDFMQDSNNLNAMCMMPGFGMSLMTLKARADADGDDESSKQAHKLLLALNKNTLMRTGGLMGQQFGMQMGLMNMQLSLGGVGGNDEKKKVAVYTEAVDSLLSGNLDPQQYCMQLGMLGAMALNPQTGKDLYKSKVYQHVTDSLKDGSLTPKAMAASLGLMHNMILAFGDDDNVFSQMKDDGVPDNVMDMMFDDDDDDNVFSANMDDDDVDDVMDFFMDMTDDDDSVKKANEKGGKDKILKLMNDHPDSDAVQRKGQMVLDKLNGRPSNGKGLMRQAKKLIWNLQSLQCKDDAASRKQMTDICGSKKLDLFAEHLQRCIDKGLNDGTLPDILALHNLCLGDTECSKKLYRSPLLKQLCDAVKGKQLSPKVRAACLNLLGLATKMVAEEGPDNVFHMPPEDNVPDDVMNMFFDDDDDDTTRSANLDDDDLADAVINFVLDMSDDEDAVKGAAKNHGPEVIASILKKHPNNESIQKKGTAAMKKLANGGHTDDGDNLKEKIKSLAMQLSALSGKHDPASQKKKMELVNSLADLAKYPDAYREMMRDPMLLNGLLLRTKDKASQPLSDACDELLRKFGKSGKLPGGLGPGNAGPAGKVKIKDMGLGDLIGDPLTARMIRKNPMLLGLVLKTKKKAEDNKDKALAKVCRRLLNKLGKPSGNGNRSFIKSLMDLAQNDPKGINGALATAQTWMPGMSLSNMLLNMKLSDGTSKQTKKDLDMIKAAVLDNEMAKAKNDGHDDEFVQNMMNFVEDANDDAVFAMNEDDDDDDEMSFDFDDDDEDDPATDNLKKALNGLTDAANGKGGDGLLAKDSGKMIQVLLKVMKNPKGLGKKKKMVAAQPGVDQKDSGLTPRADQAPATLAAMALAAMVPKADEETKKNLLGMGVCKAAVDLVQGPLASRDEGFVEMNLMLMSNLVDNFGVDALLGDDGFGRDDVDAINALRSKFAGNDEIQKYAKNISAKLKPKFPDSKADQMVKFIKFFEEPVDIVHHCNVDEDDDQILTFCMDDGEPTHDPPDDWDDMETKLKQGNDLIREFDGNSEEVDGKVIKNLIDILRNGVKDPSIAEKVAQTLNFMATNPKNLDKIVKEGGIVDIIAALRAHPDDDKLAKMLLLLLDKFSNHDVLKERIGKAGAVEVIIAACNAQSCAAKVATGKSLPPGWIQCRDSRAPGRTYFYNSNANKSTFTKPAMPAATASRFETKTEEGRTFYVDSQGDSSEKIWQKPRADVEADLAAAKVEDSKEHHRLLVQLLAILSKLCFNSDVNTKLAMEWKGVPYMAAVLRAFPESPRVSEAVINNLSNWSTASDANCAEVAQGSGTPVTDAARRMFLDKHLFSQSLNYFGNCSELVDNVAHLCHKAAADQVIGAHMMEPAFGEGMLEVGIKVLGNFAAASETIGGSPTVSEELFKSGAATSILKAAVKHPGTSGIVMNSVQALNDIALHEPGIAGALLKDGLVDFLVDLMQNYSYDQDMMSPTVELCSTAMESPAAVDEFMKQGGLQALKGVLDETPEDAGDILVNAVVAINILSANVKHRRTLDDLGLVTKTIELLDEHPTDKELVPEGLGILSRMASSAVDFEWGTSISKRVAVDGMQTIMKIIEANAGDPETIDHAFKLLGFLAYLHDNVQPIIGLGGLTCILSTMDNYSSNENLMERCVKTLDFITSDEDVAAAMKEAGGIEKVKGLLTHFGSNESIYQSGVSILVRLGISQAQEEFKLDGEGEDEKMPEGDPPAFEAFMLAN